MAGKSIDLEFTVAAGSSGRILGELREIQSTANSKYVTLDYRIDPAAKSRLEKDLAGLAGDINKNMFGMNGSLNLPTQEVEKFTAAMKEMATASKEAAEATEQMNDAQKEVSNKTDKQTVMNRLTLQMTSYAQKYGATLSKNSKLQAEFNGLLAKVRSGAMSQQEATKAWTAWRVGAREAGIEVETLSQKLNKLIGEGFKQRARMVISMSALRAARQVVADVKEIDAAMTELRKVTDETANTYNKFVDNAAARAKDIGATMSDVIKSTADFARLGYNLQEASNLADAAIVFKNVGDGLNDIDDASEKIISIVKAFPEFEGNAISVVDKMNEVGNNFAITSSGIGEALQRSAGALTAANNTLDESIALAVGMNTVTQDPAKVGTALKTLTMYLRASKTEAEEAGESTEGMAESVSKLREEILALTGHKVDILDANGDYKSTIQIMRELSQVWNELADVSQANLLERISGKRNASVVASLLQNFSAVEAALKTSEAAEGSALKENEKYLDSIQGRLDVLKATGQSIASNLLNSTSMKVALTGIQDIANVVDRLVQSLGGIPTAFAAGGIFAMFKNLD